MSLLQQLTLFQYKEPSEGYWGPVTATIDWCEENYVVSPFFAEIVNATTNLSFYFLSLNLLRSAIKNDHGLMFVFVSIGMCVVGIGSWLFHMTLKYEFQLLDELPMIYVTAIPFAYIFGLETNSKFKRYLVYVTTGTLIAGLTYIYCSVYKNPELHQASYAVLNISIVVKSVSLVKKHVTDYNQRHFLYKFVGFALFEFLFGFLVWNLDTVYCSDLIRVRRLVGLPLGALLFEGHGWWHILTSLGIFHFILYNQMLNVWYRGLQDKYELVWRLGMPFEVRLKPQPAPVAKKEKSSK
ncbi:hypothetical protein OGAPHI_003487 [Ogataea philodendri]|uniref:Alkaline ceramidase n=1 Tax=Ogataea philodendri TaxID=1378263 RepID=A0A9P8P7H5_9ASCO|nr:uncharacterized protein OGAPHI_003487 [Ogataea philodendri]KAH3666491.1 hypothetical protein OGAPHI_003487 [Ogataea philodendri]